MIFCGARTRKGRRCTARSHRLYSGFCEIHGQRAIRQRGVKWHTSKIGGRWNKAST